MDGGDGVDGRIVGFQNSKAHFVVAAAERQVRYSTAVWAFTGDLLHSVSTPYGVERIDPINGSSRFSADKFHISLGQPRLLGSVRDGNRNISATDWTI